MSIFTKLFGPREIHVHLHVDGKLVLESESQHMMAEVSKSGNAMKKNQMTLPLSLNVNLPQVDFGDDVKEK